MFRATLRGYRFLFTLALFALGQEALLAVDQPYPHSGTLRILSGGGAFSSISASRKTLTVAPGATLSGTIDLEANNGSAPNNIAPLIFTPSWGDPNTSYREINGWVPAGISSQQAAVSVVAPPTPGVYYLIFAFSWEIGSDHVASGTNWMLGRNIWDDGDEIASLSPQQLAEGQANGFTMARRLFTWGSQKVVTPVDAVRLIVGSTQETPFVHGPVAGEPEGTKYLRFGTPQVGASAATISTGYSCTPVVIGPDRTVLLRTGDALADIDGSVICKLGQPSGDAVLATLALSAANNISARNNVVLVRGLASGSPHVAARIGTPNAALPNGVTIKSFGTIDGNGSGIFFNATLQGTNVTSLNAKALCVATKDGSVKVLARVGAVVNGRTIATIGTLVGNAGTLSEGRWRVDETTCGVRLTFAGAAKEQALFAIPDTALTPDDWTLLGQTGVVSNIAALNGARITSLGLPGFGQGPSASFLANLAITPGGPTAANRIALLKGTLGFNPIVLARTGDPIAIDANGAPLTGTRIASLSDPIAGAGGQVAFTVNMVRPGGLVSRGIMYREAAQTPTLLANVGALAPGGGRWSALGALALPDGADGGPVFLGTLAVNATAGVTTKNNAGLWAMDSAGTLRLVLRTNQSVTVGANTKTLRSFTGLLAAPGSIGAASSYNNAGRIAVLANFTDGTRALLTVEIP